MENKKKFQLAVKVTILSMIVYVCAILFSGIEVKPEKVIDLYSSIGIKGEIQLPFQVSVWWNLLVFALIVFIIMYVYYHEEIVGREPNSYKANLQSKHVAKEINWALTMLAMAFLGFIPLCTSIGALFSGTNLLLSGLMGGIWWFLIIYVALGAFILILVPFLPFMEEINEDLDTTDRYLLLSDKFIKMNLLKTLHLLIGLSAGFMIRFTIVSIWKFFKKATVGFKKSPVS